MPSKNLGRPLILRTGRFFGFGSPNLPANPSYDGAFMFCRIWFDNAPNGDGNGWFVDYPRADINLSFRFSELTTATVSRDGEGGFNHTVYRLTDPGVLRVWKLMSGEETTTLRLPGVSTAVSPFTTPEGRICPTGRSR